MKREKEDAKKEGKKERRILEFQRTMRERSDLVTLCNALEYDFKFINQYPPMDLRAAKLLPRIIFQNASRVN